MHTIVKGIWPTMITPFTKEGELDEQALAAQINWYIAHGCDGLFAVCQSSEMFFLSLKERVSLAKLCVAFSAGRIPVIASGHVSDSMEEQLIEIKAIWETGVSAVVLVSNRLAAADESDDVFINNARRILEALPQVTFGMYECPFPYKRLISEKILRWMAQTGRFAFLKDTCCDAPLIKKRLAVIRDSTPPAQQPMGLYNANTMTLLKSLKDGADGFCGVMANFHPELYQWLFKHFRTEPARAAELQAALTLLSGLEGQAYPICAKKHMQSEGIPITLVTRAKKASEFGYQQETILEQARRLESLLKRLYINGLVNLPSWHSSPSDTFVWQPERAYPYRHEAPAGLKRSIIHRADQAYPFLHDTMIISFHSRLLCAWYNCTENEIVGSTVIRGRWSEDDGKTWSEPEIIAQAPAKSGLHMVPAAFAQAEGGLYAYITEMSAHDRPVGFCTYRYTGQTWVRIAHSEQPVIFNAQPVQLADGALISAGRMSEKPGELPLIPCVISGERNNPTHWKAEPLLGPWRYACYPLLFPETTLLTDGSHLTAVVRNDGGSPQVFESFDAGRGWSEPRDAGLPIGASKLCGGTLHNGRQYLIYNERTAPPGRELLVIALRKNGTSAFDRVYTLFDGADGDLNAGPMWHYPCAAEHKGCLYISCTASCAGDVKRDAALAVVPVDALL